MHDVKNQLLIALGSLELATEQAPAPLREELLVARAALERATALLRGEEEPRHLVELGQLLAESQPLFERLGAGIELQLELPSQPVEVYASARRLQGALLDLALNAAQAMPEGGELLVRLAQVDHQAILEVRDSGEGISERAIAEPGYTSKANGNGLGLSNVRATVEAYGGTLELIRRERGTSALIYLPLGGSH